jgi:broad specificity phosphatase PhoE
MVLVGRLVTYSAVSTLGHQTLSWVERLNSLRHNRSHESAVVAHSAATRLLRCRLLECELAESLWEQAYLARTLAADATAVGMPAVVE